MNALCPLPHPVPDSDCRRHALAARPCCRPAAERCRPAAGAAAGASAAARSRRHHHQVRAGRAADRIAGPGRAGARGAGARPRQRRGPASALFTEGSEVKAGQPLFQIDPAPYQAAAEQRPGRARHGPGEPDPGRRAGRALQAAGRSERRQQAGIHQRRRRPEAGRGRRGRRRARRCRSPRSTPATPT